MAKSEQIAKASEEVRELTLEWADRRNIETEKLLAEMDTFLKELELSGVGVERNVRAASGSLVRSVAILERTPQKAGERIAIHVALQGVYTLWDYTTFGTLRRFAEFSTSEELMEAISRWVRDG